MFAKLRKVTGSFIMSVCSSTWNSLDPIGWIFMISEYLSKICHENSSLITI